MSENTDIILSLFQWTVAGLAAMVAWMVRRLFLVENTQAVCGAVQEEMKDQHVLDEKRRDTQRKEIIDTINRHNDQVMARLDQIETRIKNGHG